MTHTYTISGMTCQKCVAKVKSELLRIGDISEAEVKLDAPQATITMQRHVSTESLQTALTRAGNYTITETGSTTHQADNSIDERSWLATYKPLLLVFGFILLVSLAAQAGSQHFMWEAWMQDFMAGFFLAFSFFKFLDLKGFAESYSSYDIIARRWRGWGYVYAFIELALGIAFLVRFAPIVTNSVTVLVMSISIIGVLQSVLAKRKIQCACLGAVFNLPMSTVTIVEDGLMIAMSAIMLIHLI